MPSIRFEEIENQFAEQAPIVSTKLDLSLSGTSGAAEKIFVLKPDEEKKRRRT